MKTSDQTSSSNEKSEPATPFLSVCIPTYNRLLKLRRLLAALLPQLTASCELVILDNCSDEEVAAGIHDLLAGFGGCNVRIIRNQINVGGNANILRCFEVAQGDWIWIIGDDDLPVNQAVTCILEESRLNPEAIFINFASTILDLKNTPRNKTASAEGLAEFVGAMDNFSNLLYISAGLYRLKCVRPHLRYAYSFIDTCAPHVALVLITLIKDGGETRFSHRKTVEWEMPERADGWDVPVVYKRLQRLLDLIFPASLREIWFAKICTQNPPPLRTLLSLFKYIVSRRGNLDSVRDQLEMSSYIATMVPSQRWHSLCIWFIAHLASLIWLPFYLAWSMVPSRHKSSLSHYSEEPDLMRIFLEHKRT